jgi:D-alanyl-D-alanine carboxypeptidase (penicillin-binding protein 5/6)
MMFRKTTQFAARLAVGSLIISIFFGCSSSHILAQDLADRLRPWIEKHPGKVSVAIKHLETGETFFHREKEVVPTASLIKFPILVEYYKQLEAGTLPRDLMVPLREEDKVPGSGILTDHFASGTVLSLETAAHLMITYSDNTATNLVLEHVGLANVGKTMTELGIPETQVHSKVFRRDTSIAVERSKKYGLGSTTASDMLTLLEQLHARKLVSESASKRMLDHLLSCDDKTKLLRFLPKDVKGYHKTGAVNESRTDAGLFHTPSGWIAMVCLTSENEDKSWGDENAAEILCGRIAEATYEYFHPIPQESAQPQTLKLGANGPLVEALQAALNQRLNPSPKLSVDGDFGGMTEQAVNRFRREQGLPETGIVDQSMWSKLGEIRLNESSEPPLEELKEPEPPDTPSGIPTVSCKAWAIADASSGKILAGHRQDESLDIASTTKIMTALLIARELKSQPNLLQETITFSKRADNTVGSSTTIRAGESISIRDAMYGLMLPSGNDAGVALAEWYGRRKGAIEANVDPLKFFIDAMNEEAKRLGMNKTSFRNPHGITHPEHKSSCEDLIIVSCELLQYPFVREVIATRRHECIAKGQEGYQRRLIWKNSNRLLDVGGYVGIKTGTTDAAGECLVSMSDREGVQTIVVVLGASGSSARYADSRNLHRWSWTIDRKPLTTP